MLSLSNVAAMSYSVPEDELLPQGVLWSSLQGPEDVSMFGMWQRQAEDNETHISTQ